MLQENRFYNYDDALAGIVAHLNMTLGTKTHNLALLVTDGGKEVNTYNPKLHSLAASFFENVGSRNGNKRQMMAQEAFGLHFYFEERLGRMNATVVVDELLTGNAAGTFAVIRDVVSHMAEAKNFLVGTVFIFAVEASV